MVTFVETGAAADLSLVKGVSPKKIDRKSKSHFAFLMKRPWNLDDWFDYVYRHT